MDVEIKEFSLTILVGVAFVVSLILSIRLTVAANFRISLPHLFKIGSADKGEPDKAEEILTFAHNIALVVVFLGLGLLIQDSSKSVVAQRSWPVPWTIGLVDWFVATALPPAEMTSRLEPFFAERALDDRGRTWSPQRKVAAVCDQYFRSRGVAADSDVPSDMQMSAFAKQIIPQLAPDPARPVTADIGDAFKALRNLLAYTTKQSDAPVPKCKSLLDVDYLYYRAKNRTFQNKEYFEELREIEGKLAFLRGMIFVVAITWLVYIGLIIVRGVRWIVWLGWRLTRKEQPRERAANDSPANIRWKRAIKDPLIRRQTLRHAIWLTVLLIGGYFLQDAYRAEQLNFNNRVYGYFEVLCLIGGDCLKETKEE
jgi:hypothetical protein